MEAGIWTIWDRNPTSNKLKQTNMYRIGDKVKVRSDLQIGYVYSKYTFSNSMTEHLGKWARIICTNPYSYRIDIDNGKHNWYVGMFESNSSDKLFPLL